MPLHLDSGYYELQRPQLEYLLKRLVIKCVDINRLNIYANNIEQDDIKI